MTVENPHGVIVATQDDEQAIFEQVLLLHKENGMWPLSERKVWAVIRGATREEGPEKYVIGLIKNANGEIEGSIALHFSVTFYSEWWHFVELWLFVHPDHRKTKHAQHLVKFAMWCADTMSANMDKEAAGQPIVPVVVGILTEKNLLPKMRLYQRAGLQQVGATFMYNGVPKRDTFYNQRHLEPARDRPRQDA